jgi:methylenetetrahydrofolate reductase (NADPH)
MALFSIRPFQRPYSPIERPSLGMRVVLYLEMVLKRLLFGCRMCGNCILQETSFICPMACPKGLRNGPCGGSTAERCYVDRTRPCVWYRIYDRSERMGRMEHLKEVQAPLDWSRVGRSTWLDLWQGYRAAGGTLWMLIFRRRQAREIADAAFRDLRIPDWWRIEAPDPEAPKPEPVSQLEARLRAGELAITSECTPPASASDAVIRKRLKEWRGLVDAVNFTDNPSATARMTSLAGSLCCIDMDMEPVFQLAARDRNRTSLQSEALGASSLGIRNVLSISGDHARMGPRPMSRLEPLDVDSLQQLKILRRMRDEGVFLDGRPIKSPPRLFLGAAASPFSSEVRFQAFREEKKIDAGAQFLQTQCIFDLDRFEAWLEALDKRDLLDRVYILAGITPMRSAGAGRFMDEQVPGITVPEAVIRRMQKSKNAKEEGVQIALETMARLKGLPGISGFHIMAVGWESVVPRLIEEGGLRRKKPAFREYSPPCAGESASAP